MIRQLQHEFIVYIDNISNRVEWARIVSAADAGCLRVTPCCIPRVVKNLARKFPPKTVHQKLVWQSALGVQLVLLRLEGWSRRATKCSTRFTCTGSTKWHQMASLRRSWVGTFVPDGDTAKTA